MKWKVSCWSFRKCCWEDGIINQLDLGLFLLHTVLQAVVVVGKDQPPDLASLVPKEAAKETESQQGTTELKGNWEWKDDMILWLPNMRSVA